MTIIPFEPWHIRMMDLREWDKKLLAASPDLSEMSASYFKRNGVGYTGIVDEGIVGAAGFVQVLPGNWEVWAYTTNLFPKYGIRIHRMVKHMIEGFFVGETVRRLQCSVDSTHPTAGRWVQQLGFKFEGIQHSYGPDGQDFLMFAKVKNKCLQ